MDPITPTISSCLITGLIEKMRAGGEEYNSPSAILESIKAFAKEIEKPVSDFDESLSKGERYAVTAGKLMSHYICENLIIDKPMCKLIRAALRGVAVKSGDLGNALLAKELLYASEERTVLELARMDWDVVLITAAGDGCIHRAKLAQVQGARKFGIAAQVAESCGHHDLAAILRAWLEATKSPNYEVPKPSWSYKPGDSAAK